MYEGLCSLKEKPFYLTPDPRFIYFTQRHCEALAYLVYGIRQRKGFNGFAGKSGLVRLRWLTPYQLLLG